MILSECQIKSELLQIKKRLVFHEYLSLLGLEWNNFYLISNTLFNNQATAPLLIDLGILKPLDSFESRYAELITPSATNSVETSFKNLNFIYQYSIEKSLLEYKSFLKNPYYLDTDSRVRNYQSNLLKRIKRLNDFVKEYSNFYNSTVISFDTELAISKIVLRNVQSYVLILELKKLVDASLFYKDNINNLLEENPEYTRSLLDEMLEEDVKAKKAFRSVIESAQSNLNIVLHENPLTRIQKNKARSLINQMNFILDLLK